MELTDDAAAREIDPATLTDWIVLATALGDATEYRVYSADGTAFHVVEHPDGPRPVALAVSEHGDYVSALRAVAAMIEEDDLSAGRHAGTPLDLTPRLRIRRTWFCDAGPHAGMIGIGLDPLYVWPAELDAIRAAYGSEETAGS